MPRDAADDFDEAGRAYDERLKATGAPPILSPGAPLISAREFIRRHHIDAGLRTLQHQNDSFFAWAGTHYVEVAKEDMRGRLYRFLDTALRPLEKSETAPFDPTRAKVANVLEATAAEAQLPTDVRPPAWLDDESHPPAADLIACANGLLYLPTRELLDHDPAFFSLNALPFDYNPHADPPTEWLKFLGQLWPDDPQAISTLQEIFGLLLTGDTCHQKAFLLVGPKRSGKGTIARVMTALLGQENVCGPTLNSLAQNFGLAPLIGKRVALISDARISGKADQSVIVERILSITGEDSLTIDRKFRDGWTGRLETRFVLLTNELPRLADSSGALASRFIILILKSSFFGKEDHGLTSRLTRELPGILNWSLAGWERLQQRGYFVPPASAAASQQEMEDLSSPIGAFIRDRCVVGAECAELCDQTYLRWCDWCRSQGRDHFGTVQMLGRDLRAVLPAVSVTQPRDPATGKQVRYYQGLGKKNA